MKTNTRFTVKMLAAAVAAGGIHIAQAQPQNQGGMRALEEVVVTARKREESLQDVPVAVSAVGRDTIDAAFLQDATGIAQFAPNIVFDNISAGTPGGGGISIRGISFQDVEKTFDPAVLMYIDDVPVGVNSGNAMSMLDVERIEVLRGPQGTLFGKNAVGGVVHIHRIKPVLGEWAGKARVRAGNYERRDIEGVINIPLGDDLAAKVTAARLEQDEGFYKNITTGDREGDNKEERFGVHLLWNPRDDFSAELQYNQSETDGTAPPMMATNSPTSALCVGFGVCAASPDKPLSGDRRKGAGDLQQDFFLETRDVIARAEWDINPDWTATVIYGHRQIEDGQLLDFDGSPLTLFHAFRESEYTQDSFESRLDFDAGGDFSLTAGYYYGKGEVDGWVNDTENPLFLGLDVGDCGFTTPNASCVLQTADHESKSHSVYFEGDYRLTENWILTAGSRWIRETKEISKQQRTLGAVGLDASGSRKDIDKIYRLGIRYERDDFMAYLMRSTGFRSGGFSIRAVTPSVLQAGFEPEKVINTEAGIKTTLWDGRVRLSGTVFDMEYQDMQQEINIPGGPTGNQDAVINAAEANLRGVELEVEAMLAEFLRIDFNAGYLDAEYDSFMGSLFADGIVRDLSGLDLRRAPEWNYTLGLNFMHYIGSGELTSRLSYNWRDDYATTASNHPGTEIEAFGTLDASVTYRWDQWQVSAFGRNLTDEDEYNHPFVVAPGFDGSSFFSFATPRAPRTYGLELTYTFGDY